MKITSFEISKKLAEIGFTGYTRFYYIADGKCKSKGEDCNDYELKYFQNGYLPTLGEYYYYPAYDLETILNALTDLSESLVDIAACLLILSFEEERHLIEILSKNKNDNFFN